MCEEYLYEHISYRSQSVKNLYQTKDFGLRSVIKFCHYTLCSLHFLNVCFIETSPNLSGCDDTKIQPDIQLRVAEKRREFTKNKRINEILIRCELCKMSGSNLSVLVLNCNDTEAFVYNTFRISVCLLDVGHKGRYYLRWSLTPGSRILWEVRGYTYYDSRSYFFFMFYSFKCKTSLTTLGFSNITLVLYNVHIRGLATKWD